MHKPVDGAEARAAETAAYRLLCARLQRNFETAEASDTCTLRAAVNAMLAHSAALVAENERLRDALTPSSATKAAYIGEFSFTVMDRDEDGEEVPRRVLVPWDTTKEIMAAILARTALETRNG